MAKVAIEKKKKYNWKNSAFCVTLFAFMYLEQLVSSNNEILHISKQRFEKKNKHRQRETNLKILNAVDMSWSKRFKSSKNIARFR